MVQITETFSKVMEKGNPEGCALIREILSYKDSEGKRLISIYRLQRDLGVSGSQVYNWLQDKSAPMEQNMAKIRDYSLYVKKLLRLQDTLKFKRWGK